MSEAGSCDPNFVCHLSVMFFDAIGNSVILDLSEQQKASWCLVACALRLPVHGDTLGTGFEFCTCGKTSCSRKIVRLSAVNSCEPD